MHRTRIRVAITSGAYNEEGCIDEFVHRCLESSRRLGEELHDRFELDFTLIIADNKSSDKTLRKLIRKTAVIDNLIVYANSKNYGTEASGLNLLNETKEYDIVGILCSDLQDPPEVLMKMLSRLLLNPSQEAVIGIKISKNNNELVQFGRNLYYSIGGYLSRGRATPHGYHGFGVYRGSVIRDAIDLIEKSGQSIRDSLIQSSEICDTFNYNQASRKTGISSYGSGIGYIPVAIRSILSSNAASSRTALTISAIGMIFSFCIFAYISILMVLGIAGYASGIATVISVTLFTFTIQMLQLGLLSRQFESSLFRHKKRIRFEVITRWNSRP